jgi:class 3 adenylate cyclase
LEPSYLHRDAPITEDGVEQMLGLAERLRAENGGVLDDSAIQAVAEATGAPSEYVRLAVKLRSEKAKASFLRNARSQYLTLEPNVRRYVASGVAATFLALFFALGQRFDSARSVLEMLGLLGLSVGAYNVSLAKDGRVAAICGALIGGGYFFLTSVFHFLLQVKGSGEAWLLLPVTAVAAVMGVGLQRTVNKYRDKLGMKDPVKERQDLLRQLVSLQDRLRSNEQHMTFLSLDIVGSTRMKAQSDPLSVEFTFTEYHQFVERIVRKWGGSVHSTAGDGITCAFENPSQAFSSARNIQTGIIELNTFRNKIGIPIVLRAGVHTGTVVTPQAGDIKSVNFAHVIDIAAHLQKVCPPGGIAVSEIAAAMVPGGSKAIGTSTVSASDVNAVIWDPRPSTPALGAAEVTARPSVPEQT